MENYLSEKTTTTELLNQLVTSQSHRHRHNRSRTVRLDDIRVVGFSRGVTVAVVENGIVGLVDPLPQDDIEGLLHEFTKMLQWKELVTYQSEWECSQERSRTFYQWG